MKPIKSTTITLFRSIVAWLALLMLGWGLIPTVQAQGTEYEVNCSTLRNLDLYLKIKAANDNQGLDTLELDPDCTYTLLAPDNADHGLPVISGDLIVEGNGAIIERATVPGTGGFRLVESEANLTLRNVTLRNGFALSSEGGGAIYAHQPLTLTQVILDGNRSSSGPGGAVNAAATLKLDRVTVNDNRLDDRDTAGGGIHVGGNLVAQAITVTHNLAEDNSSGGGIYVAGDALVSEATFSENEAGTGGGGLYVGGNLTLSGSRFFSNTTGSGGGGGVSVEGDLTVTGSDFFYNKGTAGGVFAGSKTTISHSRFYTNTTSGGGYGGGGLFSQGRLSVAESEFVGNISHQGGGLVTVGGSSVITGSLFKRNKGGGVYSEQSTRLENNRFVNNQAPQGGGAAIPAGVVLNNVFEGNRALAEEGSGGNFGGGLLVMGDATVRNNLFVRNQADERGGALTIIQYPGGGASLIVNNLLVGNEAPAGAAIDLGLELPTVPNHNGGLSEIHHNTIAHNGRSNASAIQIVIGAANLRNNIITRHAIGLGAGNKAVVTSDHNLYFDNLLNYAGVAAGPHDLTADPRFVAPAQGDFHLSATSPARDAGDDLGITADLDGALRPQGPGFDIGAYEFGSAPAPNPDPDPNPNPGGDVTVYLPMVVK